MSVRDETDDLLRKIYPVFGKKTKALWYLIQLSKDPKTAYANQELLRLIADKNARIDYKKEIRLPPPSPNKLQGNYHIGKVIYPSSEYSEFGLLEDEFIKHIFIAGMTGTGKTNLALHILRELNKRKKPFLVFDWKGNYRELKQLDDFNDLKVIRLGEKNSAFQFNPLIPPPTVDPRHWMTMLIDVIKSAFFGSHGVEYFLRKGINHLYEQYGIYEGKKEYPAFADLEKVMQKEYVRGREMLWMSTVKRMLASLTYPSLLGETFDVRTQQPLENLLHKKVVFEMDNLSTVEKIFFVESFLLWIYHYRKSEGKREDFKHAIIIEEGHHILSGKDETAQGEENIIETIIRMIREFGESVIVIDQEPSKISNSILANTSCKVCFNLGNGKDIETISRAMSLTVEERESIDRLKIGHAIVKMKERFSEPIHVRFPLVPINKGLVNLKLNKIDISKLNFTKIQGG
ncbi:MAG: ATP-binding protein [candidate division Zixibacteria bacterium]|nr:ATP-binding protein [candidate division Zixibacteria bacterium]